MVLSLRSLSREGAASPCPTDCVRESVLSILPTGAQINASK